MKIGLELMGGTPARLRGALTSLPEVQVGVGDGNRIAVDGFERPLVVLERPPRDLEPVEGAKALARRVPRGTLGLVVAGAIPLREREAIEGAGLSWCDGRGALHLAWPGVFVHIDRGARRGQGVVPESPVGLGPVGLRALQVLLDTDDEEEWTVMRLAERAGISTGQAHKVFRALEENRLVTTTGTGPRQRRRLNDRRAALDWLAAIDRARRRPSGTATYLYGRTLDDVLSRFAERAKHEDLRYAVTGVAASHLLGVPLVSVVPVAQVRVAGIAAADVPDRLGLERPGVEDAGRGMNLELWADTGELGTYGAGEVGGIRVAPPVRIWLDIARQGGRNDDAAQLFREQVLERA